MGKRHQHASLITQTDRLFFFSLDPIIKLSKCGAPRFHHAKIRNILSPIPESNDEGHVSVLVSVFSLDEQFFDFLVKSVSQIRFNLRFAIMATTAHGSFTGPSQVLSFDGLLFDFDGTIIDSTDGT